MENDHGSWYRKLFAPSVVVGLAKASDLAGYRNGPVYINGAMHTPSRNNIGEMLGHSNSVVTEH